MTTVDTADVYGQSEALLGQYLRLYPQRRGGLTISTKLTFAGKDMAMASKDMVQYVSWAASCSMFVCSAACMALHGVCIWYCAIQSVAWYVAYRACSTPVRRTAHT